MPGATPGPREREPGVTAPTIDGTLTGMDEHHPSDADESGAPPAFDAAFRAELEELVRWRRDVRRFRPDPIDPETVARLLALAALAPSVGNAQPWRFVLVEDAARRAAVRADFAACNADALADYEGEEAKLYAGLKLAGLEVAPVQLAVFVDRATDLGRGLGRKTMPETLAYSVVGAVQTFWLAARAWGIGVGWVSILTPETVRDALDLPESFELVAYLCVGYPEEQHLDPELQRAGWQERIGVEDVLYRR